MIRTTSSDSKVSTQANQTPRIVEIDGQKLSCPSGQSVLQCLQNANIQTSYCCQSGICHTCMLRAVDGTPNDKSQSGLSDSLKEQGYFLACICYPESDLKLSRVKPGSQQLKSVIKEIENINDSISRILVETLSPIEFRAGQNIELIRDDGLSRNYSIASIPNENNLLEFHVQHIPGGKMSTWLRKETPKGEAIYLGQPKGNCYFPENEQPEGILLIGTGSGLAPLYGILKDALLHQYQGPIELFHGSSRASGLYYVEQLNQLAKENSNFHYQPCVSRATIPLWYQTGRSNDIAFRQVRSLENWKVYLCGNAQMVSRARQQALTAGAKPENILADPFQ